MVLMHHVAEYVPANWGITADIIYMSQLTEV